MTKITKRGKDTQIRVTEISAGMMRKQARTLFDKFEAEHTGHGLRSPSSRLAIDWMIYELSRAGVGEWPELTEENNLFMMITAKAEEE